MAGGLWIFHALANQRGSQLIGGRSNTVGNTHLDKAQS